MYAEYLEFEKNYNYDTDPYIKDISDDIKKYGLTIDYYTGKYYILSIFIESKYKDEQAKYENGKYYYGKMNDDKYYDLNFNIFKEFPNEFVNQLINETIWVYLVPILVRIELTKYIINKWSELDIVQKIKDHLLETVTLTYDEIQSKRSKLEEKYNTHYSLYYTDWLYCFYYLLPNYEELIIKLMNILNLDDGSEFLFWGIYQLEPERLNKFFKRFLLECHKVHLDPYHESTGSIHDTKYILKKLKNHGYNLMADPELQEIKKIYNIYDDES